MLDLDRKYEYLIVGAGAGGATLARELSQRGKDVLLLERGRFETRLGSFPDAVRMYDGVSFGFASLPRRAREGTVIWHTYQAGGSTVVACGNGVPALAAELAQRGVDLRAELIEAAEETKTAPIDESLLSEGSQALRAAAQALGYRFDLMPKFIDAKLCQRCGNCVLGCKHGAKWTAAKTVNQARQLGAQVVYDAKVVSPIVRDGRVLGVEADVGNDQRRIYADRTILAAGGVDTPMLLQRAGIKEAGQGFFADLLVNVYGISKGLNLSKEPTMTLVDLEFHDRDGFLISPFVNHPRRTRFLEAGWQGFMLDERNLLGLVIKTRDDRAGRVYPDGTISKPVTADDRKRLDRGAGVAKETLIKAGADEKSLVVSGVQGGHPGGTAALGEVVDTGLRTALAGLYVCDASVLPRAPGLPPILTIIALAKYLAKQFVA